MLCIQNRDKTQYIYLEKLLWIFVCQAVTACKCWLYWTSCTFTAHGL